MPAPSANGYSPSENGQPAADSTTFREVSEEEVRTTAPDADEVEMHGAALPHRYYRRRMLRRNATENAPPVITPVIQSDTLEGDRSLTRRVRQLLFGKPIASAEFEKEHIGVFKALAVLSSDALSSVAYGTEASLAVLVTAGTAEATHNLLIGLTVVLLLSIVAFSYRQTIFTYPKGGGSYIVAKDNLNVNFGLIAASALMIDYVLTVSVSVSAGVLALVAPFPALSPFKVVIGVVLILLLMLVNMRGVSESGSLFAAPTYLFVGSFLFMILIGIVKALFSGGLFHALPPAPTNIAVSGHLSIFLILTAFSSGCSAMTGTEAISDGVPIFRKPQSTNAAKTLLIMAVVLGTMYAGTTYLAWRYGISPQANGEPTLTFQMATIFFSGWFRWFTLIFQFATTLILVLAANTSFDDFPRLSMFLARD
ncbi:MAG: APC family permease [Ktedonobacterales bacterium]|nr:APC family permease [Ktedonobacterales bacterium]